MNFPPDPYLHGLGLLERKSYAEAIEAFGQALARAPNDIRALFALGRAAKALGQVAMAEKFYARVLAIAPDRMEAAIAQADLLREQGRFDEAEALLKPALAAHPQAAELWLTLGSVFHDGANAEQAEVFFRHALDLRPGYVPALGSLADALFEQGRTADALSLYDALLTAEPDHCKARFHRATMRLGLGDLAGGWADYQARRDYTPDKVPVPDYDIARWDGRFRKDLRLLATGEQGIGDQIMFASLIAELQTRANQAGAHLIVACEPRLVCLFARSFPQTDVRAWTVKTRDGVARLKVEGWPQRAGADAFVEIGTLPRFYRNRISDFPATNAYLRPEPAEKSRWQAQFAAHPHPWIGVCWRSGKTGGVRSRQYAPAEAWAEFLRTLPGTLVCAQYGATAQDITDMERMCERRFVVPDDLDQKTDIDRTVAMLAALDVVVSAPTAVSWMAAAAGTPVEKILATPSWTSFGTNIEPFAPAGRICLASPPDTWQGAFDLARKHIVR